jgi:mannose-6-phosphate isomerase
MGKQKVITRSYVDLDSFVIYICMEGKCTIKDDKGNIVTIKQGESMLIPADTGTISITSDDSSKLLETYVTH